MNSSSNTRLIIFAKLPRSGQVKTRLQRLLGAEGCLALHYCLMEHALGLAKNWKHGTVELWWSDRPSQSELDSGILQPLEIPESMQLCYQRGANLGERMQYALRAAVDQGDRAVLIGTDCPKQNEIHLNQVASLLTSGSEISGSEITAAEIIVQPALDGGFVLIACTTQVPDLSGDIDWGTDKVMAQLEAELEKQQLSLGKIETIPDLDDEKDFLMLQQDDGSFLSKFYTKKKALKKP